MDNILGVNMLINKRNDMNNNEDLQPLIEFNKMTKDKDMIILPLTRGRTMAVKQSDIIRCKADGDFSRVFLRGREERSVITLKGLKYLEEVLSETVFFRTHRQHLINMDDFDMLHTRPALAIELMNGDMIPLGRRRKKVFLDRLTV